MTKSDFGLMVIRPIVLAALICANGNLITAAHLSNHMLGALLLTLPIALTVLSMKR